MEWGEEWGEEWGGTVASITTHKDDGASRLLYQFKGLPNITALACIMAERAQPIENLLASLIGILDIDRAYGAHLDTIGVILGLPRQGFNDPDYRVRLNAVASILLPNRRTVSGLLSMLRILMNDPTSTVLDSDVIFRPNFADLLDPETRKQGVVDGTLYNSVADGRDLDGVTDRVDWGPGMPDLATTPWTISARVNIAAIGTDQRIFSSERAAGLEGVSISVTTTGTISVEIRTSGTTLIRESVATVTAGISTVVTVTSKGTLSASDVHIYFDSLESSYAVSTDGTGTLFPTDVSWSLGGRIVDDTPNLDGTISETTTWSRELTSSEVDLHFNGGQRNITYTEHYPKSFTIEIQDLSAVDAFGFVPFVRLAKPATYNVTFIAAPTGFFGYGDATGTVITSTLSFGDGTETITVGGPYAAVIPV